LYRKPRNSTSGTNAGSTNGRVVARAATGVFRLRQQGKTISFIRFGGYAAKTNEKEVKFRPAGGRKAIAA
jgi:hypothetical protein